MIKSMEMWSPKTSRIYNTWELLSCTEDIISNGSWLNMRVKRILNTVNMDCNCGHLWTLWWAFCLYEVRDFRDVLCVRQRPCTLLIFVTFYVSKTLHTARSYFITLFICVRRTPNYSLKTPIFRAQILYQFFSIDCHWSFSYSYRLGVPASWPIRMMFTAAWRPAGGLCVSLKFSGQWRLAI